MNKQPIERIRDLITSLPKGDIKYAEKFLKERDFESLQLLVKSSIIRVEKGLLKENPKEEYLNVDFDDLRKLKMEVDAYCEALDINYGGLNEYDE